MKKIKILFLFSLLAMILSSCNDSTSSTGTYNTESEKTYTVKWLNYDNSLLDEETYKDGEFPCYKKNTPIRNSDAEYSYTFSGWSPEITNISKDETYVAQYSSITNTYKVAWLNWDGSILETNAFPYGSTPVYSGETPTRPNTAKFNYSFIGWSPEITDVKGNQTYVAQFDELIRNYTIKWENYDHTLLYEETYEYGSTPVYSGETPIKPDTAQFNYTFNGWSPEITDVKGNQTYVARFNESIRSYTVKWENYDHTLLYEETYEYGSTPVYSGETPTRSTSGTTHYLFKTWDKEIKPVESNITYTAVFDVAYEISWLNYDGTLLKKDIVIEGIIPSYTGSTPYKYSPDPNYVELFNGWDSEITAVSESKSYTAVYEYRFAYDMEPYDNRGYEITNCYVTDREEIFIPSTYKSGLPVLSIASNAFNNLDILKKVSIPDTVINVGLGAFNKCSNLESITLPFIGENPTTTTNSFLAYIFGANDYSKQSSYLPSSLKEIIISNNYTSIPDYAFYRCFGLTSITIPDSVESIGNSAFSKCTGLTSITIPNSVTSIGSSAFYECTGLTSIKIPNETISIGDYSFLGCTGLTSITIPDKVVSIGDGAFWGCTGLTSITIPDSVTSIGRYAFYECKKITSLTIPDNVTSIGLSSFGHCSSLVSLTIPFIGESLTTHQYLSYIFGNQSRDSEFAGNYMPSSLKEIIISNNCTSIPDYAFYRCSSLTSITIPNSIALIGEYAFWGCSSLTSMIVPNSVKTIGVCAFGGCSSLTSLTIPFVGGGTRGGFLSYIFVGYSGSYSSIPSSLKEIIITNICKSIGNNAFKDCSNITSITIPDSVESIGNSAFSGCTGLTSIAIPNSVTSIGSSAFSGCTGLTSIIIPDSVESIGNSAFSGCTGLTSITIPNKVTSIGQFAFSGCTGLTSITIPNSVTSIGNSAFSGCTGLTSITIPNSVTSIGRSAFSGCVGLTSITIPNSVKTIGNSAFSGCSGLSSITIPNSVTSIGKGAFENCSSLTSLTIPFVGENTTATTNGFLGYIFGAEGPSYNRNYIPPTLKEINITNTCKSIASFAFYNCSNLTSITIPNSVTSIGRSAFSGCVGLTSITIPNSVKTIGNSAFSGCSGLSSITIPNSVTSIGKGAFENCSSLTSLTIPFIGESRTSNQFLGYVFGATQYADNNRYVPSSLKEVILSDSCTQIPKNAFYDCCNIEFLYVSKNVESIADSFVNCQKLRIYIDQENSEYLEENGIIFSKDKTVLVHFPLLFENTSYVIPDCVTSIGESAFSGCSSLTSIIIPNSVTSIGESAFSGCSNLTSIALPNGIDSIANSTFEGCSNLTSVIIPSSVTSIGESVFKGCSNLTSIALPNGIDSIANSTFEGCSNLTSVIIPNSVTSISDNAFNGCEVQFVFFEGNVQDYLALDFNGFYIENVYFFSESQPIEEGNYWHYVNGVPTIW